MSEENPMNTMDEFTQAYVTCALWSSTDNADDSGGEPLDANYGAKDVAPESLQAMVADCAKFQADNAADLAAASSDDSQHGHDFWLTRNGHGAGFWDRGYGKVGERLSKAARKFGGVDLYVGDDGKIHAG